MNEFIKKAAHLVEALPYIRQFYGKTVVVKYGGAAMADAEHIQQVMQDVALLYFCGLRPVLVHGGGPDISDFCARLQLPVQFAHGQRVTDEQTLQIAQMVLLGKVNFSLVAALNQLGVKAVGLSGQDGQLIRAKKRLHVQDSIAVDLGWVGEVESMDISLITTLQTAGFVPVIAPLGVDLNGQAYNINADTVGGAVAGELVAEKLVFLSDVNGLYANADDPSTRIAAITANELRTQLQCGKIFGGMLPKLTASLYALQRGVSRVHILDGKIRHSMLLEIFTDAGVGTMIQ